MQENIEGFKYPVINEDLCTNCGLCKNICKRYKIQNKSEPDCYAYMAEDKIRSKSASGGVFPVLAYYFIKNGGYVCGAVYDRDWSVKHIVSNELNDIEKMRSSKYLQSDIGFCLKETKSLLDKDIEVLFTGTPCQIAGLRSYLNKDYPNLYCVDIVCHGVPSPKVFKKYLHENYDINSIRSINFRDKNFGWNSVNDLIINGQKASDDSYYELFLRNAVLRKSCGQCPYARIPRQGDITMGDFWRIEKYNQKLKDELGTSVLLVNNKKGEKFLKILKTTSKICRKVPLKYALKGNVNLSHPSFIHKNREEFFERLDDITIKENMALTLLINKNKIFRRYYKYKILSKILIGKKRKYYEEKRLKYKQYVIAIRKNKKKLK